MWDNRDNKKITNVTLVVKVINITKIGYIIIIK